MKRGKRLSPVSAKRAKELEIYYRERKVWLKEHPLCEIKLEGCRKRSGEVHHTKRRGRYLNDKTTWMAACQSCHRYVETYANWARQNGFLLDRIVVPQPNYLPI